MSNRGRLVGRPSPARSGRAPATIALGRVDKSRRAPPPPPGPCTARSSRKTKVVGCGRQTKRTWGPSVRMAAATIPATPPLTSCRQASSAPWMSLPQGCRLPAEGKPMRIRNHRRGDFSGRSLSRAVSGPESLPAPTKSRPYRWRALRQQPSPISLQGHDPAAIIRSWPRSSRGLVPRRGPSSSTSARMPGSMPSCSPAPAAGGPSLRPSSPGAMHARSCVRSYGRIGLAMSRCCRWGSGATPGLATPEPWPVKGRGSFGFRVGPSRSARRALAQGCPRNWWALTTLDNGRRGAWARPCRFSIKGAGYRGLGSFACCTAARRR